LLTIWLSLAAVSFIAAAASYLHALTVVQAADGHTTVAWFIPALADLTIFAASANVLDAYRHGEGLPPFSIAALAVSIAVTLGMNVAAGSPHAVTPWLVNVWPPVAFLLALESLLGYTRRRALRGAARVMPTGVPCPHGVPGGVAEAVRSAYEHARDCEGVPLTYVQLGASFGLDRKKVAALVTDAPAGESPGTGPGPAPAGALPSMNGQAHE
jgi:hypothetical protein